LKLNLDNTLHSYFRQYVCSNAQLLRIVYNLRSGSDQRNDATISEEQLVSIFGNENAPPLLIRYASQLCQLLHSNLQNADDTIPVAEKYQGDEAEEDEDDDDGSDVDEEEEEDDDDDEEVMNSGRIISTTSDPAMSGGTSQNAGTIISSSSVVGPSQTTGSAFFKPAAMKAGKDGGIDPSRLTATTTMRNVASGMNASTTTIMPNTGKHFPRSSPVLGTEALYEQAGWMTPNEGKALKVKCIPKIDSTIHPPVILNDVGGGIYDGNKPKHLLSVHASNQEYRSDTMTNESLRLRNTTLNAATGTTEKQHTLPSNPTASATAGFGSDVSLRQEVKNSSDGGNQIHQGNNSTSTWKQAVPVVLGLISAKGDNDDDDDDDNDNEDNIIHGETTRQGRPTNTNATSTESNVNNDTDEDFVIPRSIREIYMISNRNRRNKKAGSPTPERGVTPTSEKERLALAQAEALLLSRGDAVGRYFNDELTSGKRQKQILTSNTGRESEETLPQYESSMDVASKESDFTFMKSIGWIPNSDTTTVEEFLNQHPTSTRVSTHLEQSQQSANTTTVGSNVSESLSKPKVEVETTAAPIGVIHPVSQQQWNTSSNTNPFFVGAAAQGGGPMQQQRNFGSARTSTTTPSTATPYKGGKSPNTIATTRNTNAGGNTGTRQIERPDKKESRSYTYRKR
jgi:hypothetical protein